MEHGLEWMVNRSYLVITANDPQVTQEPPKPFLRFDITDATVPQIKFLVFHIRRLSSLLFFYWRRSGMAQVLFRQDLNSLDYARFTSGAPSEKESALDILAFVILVCPEIVMDFVNFDMEISQLFDAVVEETVYSRSEAASYDSMLELRKEIHQDSSRLMRGEELVRTIWK